MRDYARELYSETVAEPYRIKVVERLKLPNREERTEILTRAHYSPPYMNASDVYVDLATDSGSSAMSDDQWSALMHGDEAYVRSRSFYAFEAAVQDVTGFRHIIPTHQGRAAEHIVSELLIGQGSIVLSNTHFDTTKANVENRGAAAIDLISDSVWRFAEEHPFKGNFDLAKLEVALERNRGRVSLIIITVVNNLACSSPVSMENIREVRRLASRHKVPVFIDASRFAENAFLIKRREKGYETKAVADIAREMFTYCDGCWMSAKKDALVNIGGFIATNDQGLARRCQEKLVLYEGFYTYGGLARRDLEAIAVGIREGLSEDYLEHRTRLVRYLGEEMERAGLVVSKPVGSSGVFVDVEALYPHLGPDKLPGIALFSEMYLEGGVRVGAIPFSMQTVDVSTGEFVTSQFQFARFAIPRRVYTKAHMEYVSKIAARVRQQAHSSRGYKVVEHPEVLGHFFAKFAPL